MYNVSSVTTDGAHVGIVQHGEGVIKSLAQLSVKLQRHIAY